MIQKPKKCPHCGSDAMSDMEMLGGKEVGFVECLGDDCHAIMRAETEEKAIRLWNRRFKTKKKR